MCYTVLRRRQWHPTPVLLPGKSHGSRSLARLQSMGSLGVGHDWATSLSLFTFMHWRRKWKPTPAFLPGESQGQGSLVGCRLWDRRVRHDWSDLAAAAAATVWARNQDGPENLGGLAFADSKNPESAFDPQDNAFLFWTHSYAAFHNLSNCWVCRAVPSSSFEDFPWCVSLL